MPAQQPNGPADVAALGGEPASPIEAGKVDEAIRESMAAGGTVNRPVVKRNVMGHMASDARPRNRDLLR